MSINTARPHDACHISAPLQVILREDQNIQICGWKESCQKEMHCALQLPKFQNDKQVTLICVEHPGEKDCVCQKSIRVRRPFPPQAGSPGPLSLHQDTDGPCRGSFESSIFYLWAHSDLFLFANKYMLPFESASSKNLFGLWGKRFWQ